MAEEQVGQRKGLLLEMVPWAKLFTAFKVAIDPKKLLLAAVGIFVMSFGWKVLAWMFFLPNSRPQDWQGGDDPQAWTDFKRDRERWNFLYLTAGEPPADPKDASKLVPFTVDAADLASTPEQYRKIVAEVKDIREKVGKRGQKVFAKILGQVLVLEIGEGKDASVLNVKLEPKANAEEIRKKLVEPPTPTAEQLAIDADKGTVTLRGVTLIIENPDKLKELQIDLARGRTLREIEAEAKEGKRDPEITRKALELIDPQKIQYKPYGKLSTWPWFEYRGPNPYLLVTGNLTEGADGGRSVPWERGQFATWLANDQVPVLLEPLWKFLGPVVYWFYPAASGLTNRIYLFLVILWTLATWALFGGAITRIAAVQIARPTERVGMVEALRFAWSRYKSFFSAPLLPLVFIAVLTFFLVLFGWAEMFTWFFGDIIIAGLFWPIVIVVGMIMAVVLVGLIGWPMMYATISTEGSDSFDAISRSYSYVYQAPWHYLWYCFVALLYGAVLVFFVGFMGSLMVFMGKWGVSQTPGPQNREPTYLFVHAPTSFGWRDLLLRGSPHAETREVVLPNGQLGKEVGLTEHFVKQEMSWNNHVGSWLVTFWIWLLFLMVVGFGYSYFFTASTIIYLLMRRKVDDTEMEEVHLEEEFEEPYPHPAQPAQPAQPVTAAPAAGGGVMVEPPAFKPPAPEPSAPAPAPAGGAAKTQLAIELPSEPVKDEAKPPASGDGAQEKAPEPGEASAPPDGGKP